MRFALVLLSFLALASGQAAIAASPVDSKALTGDWYGGLNIPGGVLHVQLTIREENPGALSAVLVSIDQGGATFPVSTLSATSDSLHLSVPRSVERLRAAFMVKEKRRRSREPGPKMARRCL